MYTVQQVVSCAGKVPRPNKAHSVGPHRCEAKLSCTTMITDSPARELDNSIFPDRRVVRVPLPAIGPGSIVEYEITGEQWPAVTDSGISTQDLGVRYLTGLTGSDTCFKGRRSGALGQRDEESLIARAIQFFAPGVPAACKQARSPALVCPAAAPSRFVIKSENPPQASDDKSPCTLACTFPRAHEAVVPVRAVKGNAYSARVPT